MASTPYECFVYESFDEEEAALRGCLDLKIRVGFSKGTIQEERHEHSPAPLICIRTQSAIPPGWASELKAVLTRSTGFDHLAAYRKTHAPRLAYGALPKYCGRAVAEHAALLWMGLLRGLPRQVRQVKTFRRDGLTGRECGGKRVLIVGVGDIGYQVARIATGLDMVVEGVDIVPRQKDILYVPLRDGLSRAEVIVCCMNLTTENHGFFRYEVLRQAKSGALFVNVSRGEFSPLADLARLLDEDILGGVGLDVYGREHDLAAALRQGQIREDPDFAAFHKLQQHPNVILTPHNAFNTRESLARKASFTAQQIERYLRDGAFAWPLSDDAG
jgi:D-lactate dehydrogenase